MELETRAAIVQSNGVNLYVESTFRPTTSVTHQEKVIVVIHGGPDWDNTYLRKACAPLVKIGELVFFDLRGCGQSSSPEELSGFHMDELAGDVVSLLDHFQIDRAILLGYSFGCRSFRTTLK